MRPFTVDDLLKLNQFAHRCPWDLSPDGALLAVALNEANRREPLGDESSSRTVHGVHLESNGAHLLLLDTATGEAIVPFPDASMSWAGRWSPDGQTLAAFVVAPQTQACVGLWDRRTREVRLFRDAAVHCGLNFCVPQWTPDGLRIAVALVPADTQATASPTDLDVIVRSYDPKELDADQNQPFFQRRDASMCVGVVDVKSGAIARYGSGLKFNMPRLAPNGRAVALLDYIKSPVGGRSHYVHDLLVVPVDGREPHIVAKGVQVNSYASRLSWSPDSEMICFVTGAPKEPHHLWVVPADTSAEPTMLAELESVPHPYQAPWWSADGKRLVWLQDGALHAFSVSERTGCRLSEDPSTIQLHVDLLVQRHGESVLQTDDRGDFYGRARNRRDDSSCVVRINADSGKTTVVRSLPTPAANEFTTAATREFFFQRDVANGDEVVDAYPMDGETPKTLLTLNPWRKETEAPSRRVIEFEDVNGRTQRAAIFIPPGAEDRGTLPMIVTVYPGKTNSERHVPGLDLYDLEIELITGAGYAAMYPDAIIEDHDPIAQIAGVTLPAVQRAVEMGLADAGRVGVRGHSYGGYAVVALLTQTNAFRAGVANAPTGVNMTSTYVANFNAMRWCEFSGGRTGGTPWEKRKRYIENSPFFLLDQVETPLMLVCGSKDEPAAMSARETFLALRRLGKRVEMREYQRESHVMTWSAADTRDYYESVLRWFDQHLTPNLSNSP